MQLLNLFPILSPSCISVSGPMWTILHYGFMRIIPSFHGWIVDEGTLSCYRKMIKKDMEKDDMLIDTYGALEIR